MYDDRHVWACSAGVGPVSLCDLRTQNPELYEQLEQITHKRTIPFCYLCYIDAPTGRCARCGTDDLMHHLPGVGVEYGYEWVIKHLLGQEVDNISEEEQEEFFKDFIDSCYNEEVQVAFLTVNTGWAVQRLDPIAFEIGMNEYFMEDAHVEIEGKLYCVTTIEIWAEEQIADLEKDNDSEEVSA